MYAPPYPRRSSLILSLLLALAACGGNGAPTGIKTSDMQGTWSGTFESTTLMGRTLSGDVDWTFERDTFRIVFFNAPQDQAERIDGDWKFGDGKVIVTLKSSFPIDTDIGVTDTLFVSILMDEMSIKSNATPNAIVLQKTRLGRGAPKSTPWGLPRQDRAVALSHPIEATPLVLDHLARSHRAVLVRLTHPPV